MIEYPTMTEEYRLDSRESIYRCIYGGKAILTLQGPNGEHHTYTFIKPKHSNMLKFPEDIRFAYCVHEDTQFYLGMIEQGEFRLTNRSRYLPDTPIVRGVKYIVRMACEEELVTKTPMKLYHNGRCAVCGRKLNSIKALKCGVGKRCMRRCGQ